jgi:hypothetical protein
MRGDSKGVPSVAEVGWNGSTYGTAKAVP